jgi:hypothetical protein
MINSGFSDSKTLKHLSLTNFINFKIKASKMYLNEKNVIIPLQSFFNKKSLFLKDIMEDEFLYNTLIKDNKVFKVNHSSSDELNENLYLLEFLEKTNNKIINTSAFELIILNKSHLISDSFIIDLNNFTNF